MAFDLSLKLCAEDDAEGRIRIRPMDGDSTLRMLPSPGHGVMQGICFSPDGRLLAAAYQWEEQRAPAAECFVWNLTDGRVGLRVPVALDMGAADFSPDGERLAAIGADGVLGLYDLQNGELLKSVPLGSAPNRLRFHPQRPLVAVSRWQQPTVEIVDLERGRVVQTLSHPAGVYSVAWHPRGNLLAVPCGDYQVHLWDVDTGEQQITLRGHEAEVTGAAFNHRGDLLATRSWDGTVRFWNPVTGKQLLQIPALAYDNLHFSPDGRWAATGTWRGPGLKVWDARSGELVADLLPTISRTQAAFSPDGRWLVGSTDEEYQAWEVGSWRPRWRLAQPQADLLGAAAFSPDSRLLAVVYGRRRVRLVDPATGQCLATLEPRDRSNLFALCFRPDGSQLAAGGNRTIHLWDLRSIRDRLAAMDLDWSFPPLPKAHEPPPGGSRKIDVVLE